MHDASPITSRRSTIMKLSLCLGAALVPVAFLAACVGGDDSSANNAPAATPPAATAPNAPPADPTPVVTPPAPPTAVGQPPVAPPPPPAWAPSDLANLGLWLRGDLGLHVDAKTNLVTSWDDQSSAKAVAMPFAGAEPGPETSFGNQGVAFAGAQALTVADAAPIQWSGDFTVAVIASSNQQPGSLGALFGKTAVPSPWSGPVLFTNFSKGATPNQGALGGQIDGANFASTTQLALDDKTARMFVLQRSGTVLSVRVDNEAAADHDLVNPLDTTAPGVAAYIGGHPAPTVIQGFQGTVFEVIGVGASLSDADYGKLYGYAKARYGLK
jgi:hypothetical protein